MRVNSVRISVLVIAACLGARLFATSGDASTPIPVEFWHVGDDALSQKLAETVERAIRRSPEFRLTPISPGRKLVVFIMSNVKWEMVGKKTKAMYAVQFLWLNETSNVPELEHRYEQAKEISKQRGSCWDNALPICAAQIMSGAKEAARKIPQ
jgi:hypothetical protein